MKNVLLTGSSGFIGRNVKGDLNKVCNLYAPSRSELNLLCQEQVENYIKENEINIIIHAANPNPVKNSLDTKEHFFEDSIRSFVNLQHAEKYYERMYTLGSGAEYDKSRDLVLIKENDEGKSIPYDEYGLAKYCINKMIEQSDKQCNLRIFACYGPTDHYSKFITHCINCCKKNEDITIRQNCYFDYMHVNDLAKILCYFINNKPKYNAYNICTGRRITLVRIAEIVKELMKSDNRIVILKEGMNKEYTGNNDRLIEEIKGYEFVDIYTGIKMQIKSEIEM